MIFMNNRYSARAVNFVFCIQSLIVFGPKTFEATPVTKSLVVIEILKFENLIQRQIVP